MGNNNQQYFRIAFFNTKNTGIAFRLFANLLAQL